MATFDRTQFEAAEDLYYGQSICIWARWFVVATATMLILWTSSDSGELARRIVLVLGLVGINFYLQGRQMMDKPANAKLVTLASLIDIGLVTAIVGLFGRDNAMASPYFILFYPVVFAFSLVFHQRMTTVFVALTVGLYGVVCLLSEPSILTDSASAKTLAMRLITLGSMGAIGTFYWRIQRQRRQQVALATAPVHPALNPSTADAAGTW